MAGSAVIAWDECASIPESTWIALEPRNRVHDIMETQRYFRSIGIAGRRAKLMDGTHLTMQKDLAEQRMYAKRYGLGVRV